MTSHRAVGFWYNIALVSFMAIAVTLAATIMASGFSSSDATKEVLEEALDESRHGLQIVGKISARADVTNDKILVTGTPLTAASGGSVDVKQDYFKINYKLIKIDSHTITYDDINAGSLNEGSYNSMQTAVADAKANGLIDVNPYVDAEKPERTSAFIYWLVNFDNDGRIDVGELAILAIVYAEQDKPSTGEYLLVEGLVPEGSILFMERTVPNISDVVVDLGGKIKE
ncbi:MAG: hypothetical protein DWQ18_04980 [Crenarchaeota archaeon]|nr:MAG: hypothetical protein DWQ17_08150 [Thermoproteota archaeon]RDJ34242.1 MAG: hypothetical protein DWQ18_04980 [Thermoproteota archaeon]RDJ36645.1 MAG: hypothetical protein DWQ13_05630 [Thermoproteota archaeon]RDJ37825.1 MAG: hypothetical protein DWQ19_05205 [Thermoproteota archaeon]